VVLVAKEIYLMVVQEVHQLVTTQVVLVAAVLVIVPMAAQQQAITVEQVEMAEVEVVALTTQAHREKVATVLFIFTTKE
jgi:hypothetical protein